MKVVAEVSEDFGDRWNPLLVKELRQSMRSRGFAILFLGTQLVAAAIAALVLAAGAPEPGHALLMALGTCLVLSAVGVVPMFAFLSFTQEWDDNTHDLLVLSQLGPGRIAFGKLKCALLQVLLLSVSFAPYLALGLLLEGVDLVLPITLLVTVAAVSAGASCAAIALAGVGRSRGVRTVLLGLFAVASLGVCGFWIVMLNGLVSTSSLLREATFWGGYAAAFLMVVYSAGLCFLAARAHLAHPEEAPTLPARAVTAAGALVLPWLVYAVPAAAAIFARAEALVATGTFLVSLPALVSFATERERLGRVLERRLPKSLAARLLVHPLLPGGGRGALLMLLVTVAIGLSAVGANAAFAPAVGFISAALSMDMAFYLALAAYFWIYTASASLLTWRLGDKLGWRWVARLSVPVLFLGGSLAGVLIGHVIGDKLMANGGHLMNPFWVLFELGRNRTEDALPGLLAISGVLVLAQLPRWIRGVVDAERAFRTAERSRA